MTVGLLRTKKNRKALLSLNGVPEGIRTLDLWLRRPTLYPAELNRCAARFYDASFFMTDGLGALESLTNDLWNGAIMHTVYKL